MSLRGMFWFRAIPFEILKGRNGKKYWGGGVGEKIKIKYVGGGSVKK